MTGYTARVWDGATWQPVGTQIADLSPYATSTAVTALLDAMIPLGTINPYAGSASPNTNWLLCAGQAVSRTTYAALFAVLSTTYGTGDGSTTFNLPDLRGRTVAGVDNMGGSDAARLDWANTLGTASGTQTHTLSAAEMPVHTHTQNAHEHVVATQDNGYRIGVWGAYAAGGTEAMRRDSTTDQAKATSTTATNQNTGGGGAHNNMQPTMLLNYIIRAV